MLSFIFLKLFGIMDRGDAGKNRLCSVVLESEFRGRFGTVILGSFRFASAVIILRIGFFLL
jgi:hypothetical protein